MFKNYKKISFLFAIIAIFLLLTDSREERISRNSLLSLVNIKTTEDAKINTKVERSFFEILESGRVSTSKFLTEQSTFIDKNAKGSEGLINYAWKLAYYIIYLLQGAAAYSIIFYPSIMVLFFFLWTSRFLKDSYSY